jgi:hypothetical protein
MESVVRSRACAVPKNQDHRFHLNGLRWLWRYSPLRGSADGWCDFAKRKVLIHSRLKGRVRLEVECHEALHAILGPDIVSEECVTQTAKDLSRVLYSLGYRLSGHASDAPQ